MVVLFKISGTFVWVNSKQPVAASLWSGGEPDGGASQNCAGVTGSGLTDQACHAVLGFICESY